MDESDLIDDGFTRHAEAVTDTLMVDLVGKKWRLFEYQRDHTSASNRIRKGKVVRRWDSHALLQEKGKPARFETKQEAIEYAKRFLQTTSRTTGKPSQPQR